jgi:hypothetical protein
MTNEPVSRALCAVRKGGRVIQKYVQDVLNHFQTEKTFLASEINYLIFFSLHISACH